MYYLIYVTNNKLIMAKLIQIVFLLIVLNYTESLYPFPIRIETNSDFPFLIMLANNKILLSTSSSNFLLYNSSNSSFYLEPADDYKFLLIPCWVNQYHKIQSEDESTYEYVFPGIDDGDVFFR